MKTTASHEIFIRHRLHSGNVRYRSALLPYARSLILVVVLLSLSCGRPSGASTSGGGQGGGGGSGGGSPPSSNGTYQVEIRGYYTGVGTATVSTSSLQISADIQDDVGNKGELAATLPVANSHYYGTGSAMGQSITLNGHIDPADAVQKGKSVLWAGRINGTISIPGSHYGRVAGQYTSAPTGSSGQ